MRRLTRTILARRKIWLDLLNPVVLVALATVFLWSSLRPGYTLLPLSLEGGILPWHKQVQDKPTNLFISDPFYTFYPRRQFQTDALRHGTLPLWNPMVLGGQPWLGDTNAQPFYPPNILAAFVLSAARALPVLAWLHLSLTGVLMYGFLRVLRLCRWAALLGAVVWMFNAFNVVWLEYPHRLATTAWLPSVFLLYELAVQKRRSYLALLGGLLYGLSVLGGQTQIALHAAVAMGLYALFRFVHNWREARRADWRPLTMVVLVGVAGVGIGALQLLPTLQLLSFSHRAQVSLESWAAAGMPFRQVITFWMPDAFGNPTRSPYWGFFNQPETAAYFGAFACLLCLTALLLARRFETYYALSLITFALLMAWGTPLVRLMALVPGFSFIELNRSIGLIPLGGSLAAALALDGLLQSRLQRTLFALGGGAFVIVTVSAGVLLANRADFAQHWAPMPGEIARAVVLLGAGIGLAILARRWPHVAAGGIVLLTAIDLFQWGIDYNPVSRLAILYPENEVVDVLRQDPSVYRVLPLQSEWVVFGPNVLSVFGITETGGYSSLMIQRYKDLVKSIDSRVAIQFMRPNQNMLVNSHFDPRFALLNARYVLAGHDLDTVAVETSYTGCAKQSAPLGAGVQVGATFTTTHSGLNRVDVAFKQVGVPKGQPVHFRLWRDQPGGDLVADITVNDAELVESTHTFFFAPVSDGQDEQFAWAVESPGAQVAVCLADNAPPGMPAYTAYSILLQQIDMKQGVWIYQNPNALPRAYVVHYAQVASDERALAILNAPDFSPYKTVLLSAPLSDAEMANLAPTPVRPTERAEITRYDLHRVDVKVNLGSPGVLVLTDNYYPGWKVTVDGKPARLLRVNTTFRGVYLPTGAHQVTFDFAPVVLYVGLACALLTLTLAILMTALALRRPSVLR